MRLYKESGVYVIDGNIRDRRIASDQGFVFNRYVKHKPGTLSPIIASQFYRFADSAIKDEMLSYRKLIDTNYRLSYSDAPFTGIKIPVPFEFKLLDFQKAGVEYFQENRKILLADEMGLGKTIEIIATLNYLYELKEDVLPVLIVCPATLKYNWKKELNRWLVIDTKVKVLSPKDLEPVMGINIINYAILARAKLHEKKWGVVIGDEGHFIKNQQSKRSSAFRKLAADTKVLATGTPMPNRADELFPLLNWLDEHAWPSRHRFEERYVNVSGPGKYVKLNRKLRSITMIRRKKIDVLKELPDKFRQVIEMRIDNSAIMTEEFKTWKTLQETRSKLRELQEREELLKNDEDFKRRMKLLRQEVFYRFNQLSRARHKTALAKLDYDISYIKNVVSQGKTICFGYHRDVLEKIHEIGDSVLVLGGMKNKDESIERFQSDPCITLFVGSFGAAGVGINLTSAENVVFVEEDWTPSVLTQAEDRAFRIGQKKNVYVQHLVAKGSIDAMMAQKCVDKQDAIDNILDNNRRG